MAGVSGVSVGKSVINRRGEEAVSRNGLSPVSVSACVRSGSAVFLVGQTCVTFASSAGQVRIKMCGSSSGQCSC